MIIQELPLGAKLTLGAVSQHPMLDPSEITWLKVSSRNDFMSANRVIECRFDSPEPTNSNRGRRSSGNNYFPHSNVFMYLNSGGENWWHPTHSHDAPQYGLDNKDGFLTLFNENELDCIMNRVITVTSPAGSKRQFGKSTQLIAKVALPALSEITPILRDRAEGELFELFEHSAPRFSGAIFTRTGYGENSWLVYKWQDGRYYGANANCIGNIHPVIRLKPETELVFDGGSYRLKISAVQKESYLKSLQAVLGAR